MRIDVGAGYRVYFAVGGGAVVLLLCGGDKRTQARDIARAKLLAGGLLVTDFHAPPGAVSLSP